MTTGKFSATEWKLLVNAPQLIHHLLAAADPGSETFFGKRSEAKALRDYLSSHQSPSALVQSIIAAQKDADDKIKASPEEARRMIEQVGVLLEAKSDEVEGDAVRDFLMNAGIAIAQAVREQIKRGGSSISTAEQATLDTIASALKATEADKRRRREAAVAAEARKRAEEQQAKAKREAEAQAKAAEEARIQREAEARKKAEEERARREAEAQKKAAEQARLEREAQARKYAEELQQRREAQVKKEEEKAQREAEVAKGEAETVQAAAQAAEAKAETIYVVKRGDTLSGIAKAVYGKAGRWREIYEANRDIIENPNLIRPGWKLRIPD
jgi:NADH dehydrogenase [ubiquinone] 1 alpha subcomplex assembly factor 7